MSRATGATTMRRVRWRRSCRSAVVALGPGQVVALTQSVDVCNTGCHTVPAAMSVVSHCSPCELAPAAPDALPPAVGITHGEGSRYAAVVDSAHTVHVYLCTPTCPAQVVARFNLRDMAVPRAHRATVNGVTSARFVRAFVVPEPASQRPRGTDVSNESKAASTGVRTRRGNAHARRTASPAAVGSWDEALEAAVEAPRRSTQDRRRSISDRAVHPSAQWWDGWVTAGVHVVVLTGPLQLKQVGALRGCCVRGAHLD